MKSVSMGSKKKVFCSIKLAAKASDIKYITLYQRLRAGIKASTAIKKPVRVYKKRKPVYCYI